jgi:hypothetical protein
VGVAVFNFSDKVMRSLFGAVLTLAPLYALGSIQMQDAMAEDTPMQWVKGQYTYRTIDEHRFRGLEDWILHIHPDGSRTMTATVDNVDANVQFHMVQRVAANFRPIEAFLTHWVRGERRGSTHVVVESDLLTATINTPDGQDVQTLKVGEAFTVQPHPVSTDSWRGAFYGLDRGGVQSSTNFNISVAPNSPAPLRGAMEEETIEFLGNETITVPAGTFEVEHYKFRGRADAWLMPENRILVRYAYFDQSREYILTDFSESP